MKFFKITESLYSFTARKNAKKSYRASKNIYNHEALNEGFGGFLRTFDFIPQLKKISCPTLILAGQDDWICRPSQARTMAEHIPHAKLKIFRHCGHALSVDAHDKYIRAVSHFLAKR